MAPHRPSPASQRIGVIATGGTIQTTLHGIVPFQSVLARLSQYEDAASFTLPDVVVEQVLEAGANTFTPREWLAIRAALVKQLADETLGGFVVTHGTFTAEETAYFLHLTAPTDRPVVVTCSQRKHGTTGNDGDRNLVDALRVAADARAAGRGVLLVANEEIHSAREVTKTNQRPGGFVSGGLGLLGSVESDGPSFYRSPARRHTLRSEFSDLSTGTLPRVDIVATYAGADGTAVRAFVDAGAQGLVVNGFAYSGMPHPDQVPDLEWAMAHGVAVVLASRGNGGRIPVGVSGPFIAGDTLSAQKARILLSLALTRTHEPSELQRIFLEY